MTWRLENWAFIPTIISRIFSTKIYTSVTQQVSDIIARRKLDSLCSSQATLSVNLLAISYLMRTKVFLHQSISAQTVNLYSQSLLRSLDCYNIPECDN